MYTRECNTVTVIQALGVSRESSMSKESRVSREKVGRRTRFICIARTRACREDRASLRMRFE